MKLAWVFRFLILPIELSVALFSKLTYKQKNLWIFSAWEGRAFNDNSKYFFLYVLKNHPEIECFWVTRNIKLFKEMRETGLPCLYQNTSESFLKMFLASKVFTTHGIYDLVPSVVFGAQHIELGHATCPIKLMEYDSEGFVPDSLIKRIILFIKLPFLFKKADFGISTSDQMKKIAASSLGLPENKIILSGQPRSDIFYEENFHMDEVKLTLFGDWKRYSKIIYFVPTFRNDPNFSFFSEELKFSFSDLINYLERENALFVIRLHPFDLEKESRKVQFNHSRIYFENLGLTDPYPLLKKADILITDYSSIFADFLLLDRPIIFANFKHDEYLAKERKLYWEYDFITPGPKAQDWATLIKCIEEIKSLVQGYSAQKMEIFNLIYSSKYKNCSSSMYEHITKLKG